MANRTLSGDHWMMV